MDIAKLGVVGGGTMGTGIAQSAASSSMEVILVDVDAAAARRGIDAISANLDRAVKRGRLGESDAAAAIERITATDDYGALGDCDLTVEAADMSLDNLVKVTTYLTDRAYADENGRIRRDILGERRPAMTVVVAQTLEEPWLLEIEAIAAA